LELAGGVGAVTFGELDGDNSARDDEGGRGERDEGAVITVPEFFRVWRHLESILALGRRLVKCGQRGSIIRISDAKC